MKARAKAAMASTLLFTCTVVPITAFTVVVAVSVVVLVARHTKEGV